VTIFFMALLAAVACQQQQPQQYGVDSKSGQTAATGFVPINDDRRITVTVPETSSVQSRDYSGGSEFYGYNNYPNSYGPPSTSYGSGKNAHVHSKWAHKTLKLNQRYTLSKLLTSVLTLVYEIIIR